MTLEELAEKNTVHLAREGDIVLVGEEHGNRLCGDLMHEVLEVMEPSAVGVEHGDRGVAAMGQANHYARLHNIPLTVVDDKSKLRACERSIPSHKPRLYRIANTFREPITEGGDAPLTSIESARRTIYELYGEEVYDAMYDYREDAMAEGLEKLVEEHGGPVLGVVGTFHILAIKERLKNT